MEKYTGVGRQSFGQVLRAERERAGVSLYSLNRAEHGVDAAYLSRVERDQITPRIKSIEKIADAITRAAKKGTNEGASLRDKLLNAAGHRQSPDEVEQEIRQHFALHLSKLGFQPGQVQAAVKSTSVDTMKRVLQGDEEVETAPIRALNDPAEKSKFDQEVVVIPDFTYLFRAGPRASIDVRGEISDTQSTQLRTVARLVEQILKG